MSQGDDNQNRISYSSNLIHQSSVGRQNDLMKSASSATKDTSSDVVNNIPSSDVSIAILHQTDGNSAWKSEHHQAAILIQVGFKSWLMHR